MDKRIKYGVLALFYGWLILGIMSCRKDRIEPKSNQIGFEYSPLSIGNTWLYQVDSIHFNAFTKSIDTFHFFEKHQIKDTSRGDLDQLHFHTDISRSTSKNGKFVFVRNQLRSITNYRLEIVDSNSRHVALVFPPDLYNTWNPNQFNTKEKENAEVINKLSALEVDSIIYNDVVCVMHYDQSFQILRRYKEEKFAKNIGLIFANQIDWTKKTIGDSTEIPNGFNFTYKLIDFEN